jgi:hypothetical protein
MGLERSSLDPSGDLIHPSVLEEVFSEGRHE